MKNNCLNPGYFYITFGVSGLIAVRLIDSLVTGFLWHNSGETRDGILSHYWQVEVEVHIPHLSSVGTWGGYLFLLSAGVGEHSSFSCGFPLHCSGDGFLAQKRVNVLIPHAALSDTITLWKEGSGPQGVWGEGHILLLLMRHNSPVSLCCLSWHNKVSEMITSTHFPLWHCPGWMLGIEGLIIV